MALKTNFVHLFSPRYMYVPRGKTKGEDWRQFVAVFLSSTNRTQNYCQFLINMYFKLLTWYQETLFKKIDIQCRSKLLASFVRYVEAVFPGEYGIPKPFYFPFLPSYWTGHHHQKNCTVNPVSISSITKLMSYQYSVCIKMFSGWQNLS